MKKRYVLCLASVIAAACAAPAEPSGVTKEPLTAANATISSSVLNTRLSSVFATDPRSDAKNNREVTLKALDSLKARIAKVKGSEAAQEVLAKQRARIVAMP